jgi:hypothetical protein
MHQLIFMEIKQTLSSAAHYQQSLEISLPDVNIIYDFTIIHASLTKRSGTTKMQFYEMLSERFEITSIPF